MRQNSLCLAGKGVNLTNTVNLIAEKLHTDSSTVTAGGKNLHRVSSNSEFITHKVNIITLVLNFDQLVYQLVSVLLHTLTERDNHIFIIHRISDRIDTGNRSHDNNISALRQSGSGRVAQLVYLVIDSRILFDISICGGYICLRLIIIIVGHKILNGVVRKKLSELTAKLGCKSFVMS